MSRNNSDSEDERAFSAIDLKHIKVTPDALKNELERPPEEHIGRPTIQQLTKKLRDELWTKTEEIHKSAPALQPGHRILYRVHGYVGGEPDLKSAAEKCMQQRVLTEKEKANFVRLHAAKNQKSIGGLNSPFVSTTSDIRTFVSRTFQKGVVGDPNLRDEVFESAASVSIFSVPLNQCREVLQEQGFAENEVLYDTSYSSLESHKTTTVDNPFRGRVSVGLSRLAKSRGQQISKARELDKKYGIIPQDKPITDDIVREYTQWYEEHKCLYNDLIEMKRIQQQTAEAIGNHVASWDSAQVTVEGNQAHEGGPSARAVNSLRQEGFGLGCCSSSPVLPNTPTNAQRKKKCCSIS